MAGLPPGQANSWQSRPSQASECLSGPAQRSSDAVRPPITLSLGNLDTDLLNGILVPPATRDVTHHLLEEQHSSHGAGLGGQGVLQGAPQDVLVKL